MAIVLLLNVASTWFMVGVIWFVQLVHYPQFAGVGIDAFVPYHRRHTRFTSFVVVAPMVVELLTSIALVARVPARVNPMLMWIGVALVAIVWASTFLQQVPRHAELARGFDSTSCSRLCRTNWLRTVAWSARGIVTLVALASVVGVGDS